MDYFVGVEIEGPYSGEATLFVASDKADEKDIIEYLTNTTSITHVYFGAWRTHCLPKKYVDLVHYLLDKGWKVTLEIDSLTRLNVFEGRIPDKLHIMLTFPMGYVNADVNWSFKFDGLDKIVVLNKDKLYVNSTSHICYQLDKELQF